MADSTERNRIVEFAETHPQVLLAAVVVLVIMLIYFYMSSCGWDLKLAAGCKKKDKKKIDLTVDEESELDELIAAVNAKQGS